MNQNSINDEKLTDLVKFLKLTRPQELTCDEWLDQVSAYAEAMAADLPAPTGSELVLHHLNLCKECREEFDALVAALRAQ